MRTRIRRYRGRLALAAVVLIAVAGVAVGSLAPWPAGGGATREFDLQARQWAYSPARLRVNKGDLVRLRLRPQDVSHGLYLDGYGLETHAIVGGEATLEFVADRAGQFRFRCSVTCGPLHPFMVGQLNVETGTPGTNAPFLGAVAATLIVGGGSMAYAWRRNGSSDGS